MRVFFRQLLPVTSRALSLFVLVALLAGLPLATAAAADTSNDGGISLQVSPSPIIATINPGVTSNLVLTIRNTGDHTQALKMGLQSFTVGQSDGRIQLNKNIAPEAARFVSFADPTFSIEAGQIFTQKIIVATPASAGFTYSFAITVSQQNPAKAKKGSSLQGTVAVFTLLSVDRPGATSKLELSQLSVSQHVYSYLPATVTVKLKNTGNTLIQPSGNIFIQRHSDDAQPLATIPLNGSGGYILPDSSRSLSASWNDGFPHYKTVSLPGQKPTQSLSWDGSNISKLRFGRYVAKVVAVYSDNGHDTPLNAEVSFWVIPWIPLLVILLIVAFLLVGMITILRKSSRVIKRKRKPSKPHAPADA